MIGGAYERPKIVEELELALGELQIEWVDVPDTSPAIGRTLAELGLRAKTGVTVIAILREPEPVSGAQPGDVIQQGDTLVAVGKAGQFAEFRRLLAHGPLSPSADGHEPTRRSPVDGICDVAQHALGLLDFQSPELGDDVVGGVEEIRVTLPPTPSVTFVRS